MIAATGKLERQLLQIEARRTKLREPAAEQQKEAEENQRALDAIAANIRAVFDVAMADIRRMEAKDCFFSQSNMIESAVFWNLRRFDDSESLAANHARLELELSLTRAGIMREVVVLEVASEDDIRRTHRRYFVGIAELTAAHDPRTERR